MATARRACVIDHAPPPAVACPSTVNASQTCCHVEPSAWASVAGLRAVSASAWASVAGLRAVEPSAWASVAGLRAVSASVVSSSGSAAGRSSQRAVSFAAWAS